MNNSLIAEILWELLNSPQSVLNIGYRHYAFLIYKLVYGDFPPISSKKYDYLFDIDMDWLITNVPKQETINEKILKLKYLQLDKKKQSIH